MFTYNFFVDLAKQTCSCNFWDLIGISCRDVVAAIHKKFDDPIKYVHKFYHRNTYITYYNENGQNKWPKTIDPIIFPPMFKRGPNKPKKLRRREPDEATQTRWKRTNMNLKCNDFLKYGHNKRTCNKNKQLVVIPGELETDVETPPHVSQTPTVQARPKKMISNRKLTFMYILSLILDSYLQ